MYFRYTISAGVLFCPLFIAVIGCDHPGDVVLPPPPISVLVVPETPVTKRHDPDTQLLIELAQERLKAQGRLDEANRQYRRFKLEADRQETQLKKYFGNKSIPNTTLDLFETARSNNNKGIPSELYTAYSCWLALIQNESHLEQIDKRMPEAYEILIELDEGIKIIENKRLRDKLGNYDRNKLDRLLVLARVLGADSDSVKMALFEQDVIDKLRTKLSNRE